jgi:hypothetical protein
MKALSLWQPWASLSAAGPARANKKRNKTLDSPPVVAVQHFLKS